MAEITRQDLVNDDAYKVFKDLKADVVDFNTTLDQIKKTSKEFSDTLAQGGTSTGKLQEAVKGLNDESKVLNQLQQQIANQQVKLSSTYQTQLAVLNETKEAVKQKTLLGDKDAISVNAQNSSIKQLSAALDINRQAYSRLTNEQQRNSAEGKNLLKTIQEQDKSFKSMSATLGQNQAKVGDYKQELAGLFEKLGDSGNRINNVFKTVAEASESLWGILIVGIGAGTFAMKQFFDRTEEGRVKYEIFVEQASTRWDIFKNKIAEGTKQFLKFIEADQSYYDYKARQRAASAGPEALAEYKKEQKILKDIRGIVLARTKVEEEEVDIMVDRISKLDHAKKLELEAGQSATKTAQERFDAIVEADKIYKEVQAKDIELATTKANLANYEIKLRKTGGELTLEDNKNIQANLAAVKQLQLDFDSASRRRALRLNEIHKELIKQYEDEQLAASKLLDLQTADRIKAREGKSQASLDSKGRITNIKHDADIQASSQKYDMLLHLNKDFQKTLDQAKKDTDKEKEQKEKKEEEREKDKVEKQKELARTSSAAIVTIVNEQYAAQEERQQRYLSRLQETYQEDMAIAGTNTAAKIQLTEQYRQKEAAAQRELITLKRKQAEFDKAAALFNIGIHTAEAIMTDLKKYGMPEAIPFIALDGAEGLAQAAAVATKPLPAYFKGTEDHPGGLAMVGEQGEELIKYPSGLIDLTPRQSTIMDLPRGTEVLPNKDTLKFLALAGLRSQDVRDQGLSMDGVISEIKGLRGDMQKQKTKFPNYAKMASGVYELRKEGDAFMKSVLALTVSKK